MKKNKINFPISFYGSEELGRLIKRVRKLRGLKQADLALKTNTSARFISHVENGKETAQIGKILLLLRVLDLGTQLIDLSEKD